MVDFYRQSEPNTPKTTIYWRIHELVQKGVIARVGKGRYQIGTTKVYIPQLNNRIFRLNKWLANQFPFASYCIWSARWIQEFAHHIPKSDMLIVEVERDILDSAELNLIDHFQQVNILRPRDKSLLQKTRNVVIIRPLIEEAPVQEIRQVPTNTLEKFLVDIVCNTEFEFLAGSEMENIYKNAFDKYTVNRDKMMRYAGRRGKRENISKLINTINWQ